MTLQEIQYATNKLFYQLVEYSKEHSELPERVDTALSHAAAQLIKLRITISDYVKKN